MGVSLTAYENSYIVNIANCSIESKTVNLKSMTKGFSDVQFLAEAEQKQIFLIKIYHCTFWKPLEVSFFWKQMLMLF